MFSPATQERSSNNRAVVSPASRPNLATLDGTRAILLRQELSEELSADVIRHLSLLADGVAFAMQWQSDTVEPVPLLGIARGDSPQTCPVPEEEAFSMRGYVGSIATATDGTIVITSPRGGVAMIHGMDGVHRETLRLPDICGAAPGIDAPFTLTDGSGAIWAADPDGCNLSHVAAAHDAGPSPMAALRFRSVPSGRFLALVLPARGRDRRGRSQLERGRAHYGGVLTATADPHCLVPPLTAAMDSFAMVFLTAANESI